MRRIIDLHVADPSKLRFETNEQREAFIKAIGYAVFYGITRDEIAGGPRLYMQEDCVAIFIDPGEITSQYYRTLVRPSSGDKDYWGKSRKFSEMDAALDSYKNGRPFVMGGIPNQDGTDYSFHF